MAIYIAHPTQSRLLIVPNKTASMYVEIQANYRTISRSECNPLWSATLIVRDPASWYVSGYRHCTNPDWIRTDPSYAQYNGVDFESHLVQCLTRRSLAAQGRTTITPWDFHSWMNCRYQAEGRYYGLSTDQNYQPRAALNVQEIVQLEDTELFNRTVQDYTGKRVLDAQRHNENWGDGYPEITDECAGLLAQLDDWSHSVGYDLNHSIAAYRKEHVGHARLHKEESEPINRT